MIRYGDRLPYCDTTSQVTLCFDDVVLWVYRTFWLPSHRGPKKFVLNHGYLLSQ